MFGGTVLASILPFLLHDLAARHRAGAVMPVPWYFRSSAAALQPCCLVCHKFSSACKPRYIWNSLVHWSIWFLGAAGTSWDLASLGWRKDRMVWKIGESKHCLLTSSPSSLACTDVAVALVVSQSL